MRGDGPLPAGHHLAPGPDDLQSGGYLHCQPHPLISGGTGGHPDVSPSPARVWAPPPCRTTSATSTSTTQKRPFVHAHNFYLQVWIEAGLLGFLGFVGSMLWNIKKGGPHGPALRPSAARTITCAGAAALCGAMVCGLADYLWNYPRVMCIFWFVFALTIAGIKVCRRETEAA